MEVSVLLLKVKVVLLIFVYYLYDFSFDALSNLFLYRLVWLEVNVGQWMTLEGKFSQSLELMRLEFSNCCRSMLGL